MSSHGWTSRLVAAAVCLVSLAGCSAPLSTLDPAGPGAYTIAKLWWVMLAGAVLILISVTALALFAFKRRRWGYNWSTRAFLWAGGLAFPLVVLAALTLYALPTGQAILIGSQATALRVQAHAHQFWWEFVYEDGQGNPLYTASHLHVPAGQAVEVQLIGEDVIHSFWVPRLSGKMDVIPGHPNAIRLLAEQPGRYWGQCSEFCGEGHAFMRLLVEAHAPEDFAGQLAMLAAAGPDPTHPGAVLFTEFCAQCHSIDPRKRGSGAPNLAGLGERLASSSSTEQDLDFQRDWLQRHQSLRRGAERTIVSLPEPDILERIHAYLMGRP